MRSVLLPLLLLVGCGDGATSGGAGDLSTARPLLTPLPSGPRLQVLFLGDRGHHVPAERLQQVYGELARRGVAIDWEEDLSLVDAERLALYDAVAVYANFPDHAVLPPDFGAALQEFVADKGRGLIALHCASACFPDSPEWTRLVGARFASHGTGTFADRVVAPAHALLAGWEPFTSWDETYVHADHAERGRTVLTVRDEEPWTWVREEGKGRVFYTAWGHDQRTWGQPGFIDLLVRAVRWTAGAEAAARHDTFALPVLAYEERDTVPNYERRDPPPRYQLPLAPEAAEKHLQPAAGLRVELFASEPDIVDPIAFCFDERGRLFVLESVDYPNDLAPDGRGNDRIKICEDTDGDGRADRFTVYAEGLNVPTGILKARDGILVAQAPDLLLLRDTDGDDVADTREVLFSGFGRSDTHAGPSSLTWGPNGKLYGTVGYAGFRGIGADGGELRFAQGVWRCEADGSGMEFVAGFSNNTWGMGWSPDGELWGSTANGAPSFFVGVPKTVLAAVDPGHPGAAPVFDGQVVHPTTWLRQVDFQGGFTAAAGHTFVDSPVLPGYLQGDVLVCEPTAHVVARLRVEPDGSGFRTVDRWNLVVSSDEWFAPVQAQVGHDGTIWIADFADYLVQHNPTPSAEWGGFDAENGPGNAHVNPLRDDTHGRIWRVIATDRAPLVCSGRVRGEMLDADYAMRTIAQPGIEPGLRKRCLAALPATSQASRALYSSGRLQDDDLALRRHAWLAAARMPADDALGAALAAMLVRPEVLADAWLPLALRAAGSVHAVGFLSAAAPLMSRKNGVGPGPNLVPNPGFEEAAAADPARPADSAQPAAWRVRGYSGEASHLWGEPGSGRGGGRAVRIESATGADSSWCVDVAVEPRTRYRLSGWIRGEGLQPVGDAFGALYNLHARGQSVTGTVRGDASPAADAEGWTQVALEFETGPNERSVSLNALFGGWGWSRGAAWYDDVELRALGSADAAAASVATVARAFGEHGATAEVMRYLDAVESGRASATPALLEALGTGIAARGDEPMGLRVAALAGVDLEALAARAAGAPLHEGGDATVGERLFREHPIATCHACHAIGGLGGAVGPALDGVGARLDRERILQSILEPSAVLAEGYPGEVSPMPALRPFLTDAEIRDLVAYLASLR